MSDSGPDRRSLVRVLAALDRKVFHPEIYEDLANEDNDE